MSGIDPLTKREVPLFNPRIQSWHEHFAWANDRGMMLGLTPTGRATVIALEMNSPRRLRARKLWFIAGLLP